MTDNAQWVRPVRSAGCDGWDIVSEPDGSTWSHTGLHVGHLAGRASVFAGPTDVATKSDAVNPFRHVAVADVQVELRGAGVASREVRTCGTPGLLDSDSMIACEVVTPAGNWSSYPLHKHDQERPGVESELEEIYCSEAGAPEVAGASPIGDQRVYDAGERPIDVPAKVRAGDVVLVPHGWHGPALAATGCDLYYLNVMAGPGPKRAWLLCDDPDHGGMRDTWSTQATDPRLPLGSTR